MEFQDERELIAAELAVAMLRELNALTNETTDGQVLAVVERATVEQGRRFVRDRLQYRLNAQVQSLEKRGTRFVLFLRRSPPQPRQAPTETRHRRGRRDPHANLVHLPPLRSTRPSPRRAVGRRGIPRSLRLADSLSGRRPVVVSSSPHQSPLREVAGSCVCDNTVRKLCDHHGARMRAWQRDDPEASRLFRRAEGDVEFQTDGTCVNTVSGWREVL